MKSFFLLVYFFAILVFHACLPTASTSFLVKGTIEYNSNYCGGAAPPQELLDELAIYRNAVNEKYYIRKGNTNTPFTPVFSSFTTDSSGNYSVYLPIGNYAVISQEKYNMEQGEISDSSCTYLLTPDFTITVTNASNQIHNKKYTKTCSYVCSPFVPL